MKATRLLKIGIGIIIFLTLPTVLLFGVVYITYNEELPVGTSGIEADTLAHNMLNALDYKHYEATPYLEWTFNSRHHYKWNKKENTCTVSWKRFKVELDLSTPYNSKVYVANTHYDGVEKNAYIQKAVAYFNNDSFWLVAPYKVFDEGTTRQIVITDEGKEALLVTYTSGGTTPGDSYLWHLNAHFVPVSYQMWVDILPISGLEATWEQWMTTQSGAKLPTFHKLLVMGLALDNVKGY